VKPGRNVIAIRMFDDFGGGGFGGQTDQLFIRRKTSTAASFYHPDYRTDFKHGDNPYRYYRW
jgi:beta-galactosidase